MNQSENIGELAKALTKAQAAMRGAATSGTNSHFNSVYATLDDVISAVREPLTSNGLSWVQQTDDVEGGVGVWTMLLHESGQWIRSLTVIPTNQKSAHAVGSAITYARRFGLAAMCGISPKEEDDDANVAATGERDPMSKVQEIVDLLRDACERGDKHGWWEVWSELKKPQVDYLFSQGTRFLSSKMKSFAKTVQWEMEGKAAVERNGGTA